MYTNALTLVRVIYIIFTYIIIYTYSLGTPTKMCGTFGDELDISTRKCVIVNHEKIIKKFLGETGETERRSEKFIHC